MNPVDFHKVTLEDKDWILDRLAVDKFYGAEYCFSNMLHWQENYNTTIGKFEDFAVIRSGWKEPSYCYFGSGDRAALMAALEEDAQQRGDQLRFHGIMTEEKQRLEELFPEKFAFEESRESFDYCYTQEKLAELRGRKLSAKRNHINRFVSLYSDWNYEQMNEENISDCKTMLLDWYRAREEATGENLDNEKQAIFTAMDNFDEEKLIGGVLRVEGKVIAFTIGHPVNEDVIVVHFEKADMNYPGAYQMINQQFARNSCQQFKLMNREEDMGLENLRKAKLSYEPDELLVKYTATLAK